MRKKIIRENTSSTECCCWYEITNNDRGLLLKDGTARDRQKVVRVWSKMLLGSTLWSTMVGDVNRREEKKKKKWTCLLFFYCSFALVSTRLDSIRLTAKAFQDVHRRAQYRRRRQQQIKESFPSRLFSFFIFSWRKRTKVVQQQQQPFFPLSSIVVSLLTLLLLLLCLCIKTFGWMTSAISVSIPPPPFSV